MHLLERNSNCRRKKSRLVRYPEKQPHDLTQNELDFLKVGVIPEDADPEYTKLRTARTVDWNGRTVIEIEGETIIERNPGIQSFTITYDRGDGFCPGAVYFSGKREDYSKYLDKAKEAMKSIQWAK